MVEKEVVGECFEPIYDRIARGDVHPLREAVVRRTVLDPVVHRASAVGTDPHGGGIHQSVGGGGMVADLEVFHVEVQAAAGAVGAEGNKTALTLIVSERHVLRLPHTGGSALEGVEGGEGGGVVTTVHDTYKEVLRVPIFAPEVEVELDIAYRVDIEVWHDGVVAVDGMAVVAKEELVAAVDIGFGGVALADGGPACGHLAAAVGAEIVAVGQWLFVCYSDIDRGTGGAVGAAEGIEGVCAVGGQGCDEGGIFGDVDPAVAFVARLAAGRPIFYPVVGVGKGGFGGAGKPERYAAGTCRADVGQGTGGHREVVEKDGGTSARGGEEEGDIASRAVVIAKGDMLVEVGAAGGVSEGVDRDEGGEVGAVVHDTYDELGVVDILDTEVELQVEEAHAVDIEVGHGGVLEVAVVAVEVEGTAAAVIGATVGSRVAVAIRAMAVPVCGDHQVAVLVEILAERQRDGIGGLETIGQAEAFA